MFSPRVLLVAALAGVCIAATTVTTTLLPDGWHIAPPSGSMAIVGTMPQGLALSPDGTRLAVVESGFNPPALRILSTPDLHTVARIALDGAFGQPVWADATHVWVAGANTDALLRVDVAAQHVDTTIPIGKGTWPCAVALSADGRFAVSSNDASASATIVELSTRALRTVAVGHHPGAAVFSRDGHVVYVANRGVSGVAAIDTTTLQVKTLPTDLHPAALALSPDARTLYVAASDADALDALDLHAGTMTRVDLSLPQGSGASPNGIAIDGNIVYVSLGAENAIAIVRDGAVTARLPAGWYPSDVAVHDGTLYVANGKGESSHANAQFDPRVRYSGGYVAATLNGSVRSLDLASAGAASTRAVLDAIQTPGEAPAGTIVRAHGPIEHVIYIIKENRTYDQVLGDLGQGDGDPKLTWFGENVTPNEHAIARRFGIFDNAYADAQVSANGHNWSTAALANDYLERYWPPNYGHRRPLYDFEDGAEASVPQHGYIWDALERAGIAFRDYGEFVSDPDANGIVATHMPGLQGHIDPHFVGFNLTYSDEARFTEWQHEFNAYVKNGNLPPFEILRFPNDHTAATRPGALTPQAYVAQNDHAVGRLVEAVSHSPYWKNTAIFSIEDDAQNGPDHVDDQRTTVYVASAYAAPGVHHGHYTTSSLLHTMELFLGLPPMTIYDAVAPPMYEAFASTPTLTPYDAIAPRVDVTAKNERTAYGASTSTKLDFTHEDAVDPSIMNDILAHTAHVRR